MTKATPKLAVLVSGPSEASVRRLMSRHLKPNFNMQRNQWRALFRDAYPLVMLGHALRQGEDAEAVYGKHAGVSVLVLPCLDESVPGSGFGATRDWCKAKGFDPVALLPLKPFGPECDTIDALMDLVNFVNLQCPWPSDEIEDLDDYLAKSNKPLW
ncbi:MAG: hypothetical protein RDU24_10285 [Humidesulfovibrio sp.]|uniref:hypothetical protein n=1 Tax=Humidesulfovibrio sp. TaxID=2910988 RepID=UPI0027F264D4|nr:hypothetical protein [Humidesulfovibrio sp.]MDQ7835758.1 hypothetical protein [Humidesulfovibrio sp.]